MILCLTAAGKLKDPGLRSSLDEYVKRSKRFIPMEVSWERDAQAISRAVVASGRPRVRASATT